MAKGGNKGKSRRRVKDWHARLEADERADALLARREKFAPRDVKLGPDAFGGEAESHDERLLRNGMVTGVFRRGVFVRIDGREWFCNMAKTYRPPEGEENASPLAVGDDVCVAPAGEEHLRGPAHLDRNRIEGMILSRRPRRTALARPQPRSDKQRDVYDEESFEKVLVANMDNLLIVASVASPPIRPGLIDRFLIIARRGGLTPVLVLNKIDLGPVEASLANDMAEQGVEIRRCSARTGEGIDALRDLLTNKRCVLAGASGVGKTSLVNVLVPDANAPTREVRAKDERGRHTTTQARIYDLPGGGLIVDTPGLRELDVGLTAAELPWYFPEFASFAPQCRFRDCTHTHEPACAVRAAVDAGRIPSHRYDRYLRILETLK